MYNSRSTLLNTFYSSSYSDYSKKLYSQEYPENIRYELRNRTDDNVPIHVIDFMDDENIFEAYIKKFYVIKGQVVNNIKVLYYKINQLDISTKWELIDLININTQKIIKEERRLLTKIESILLDLINQTIYVENGHPSELWYSIIINGKVCGSLTNNGIEADVQKNDTTFSLKCYKKLYNLDLGSLDNEFVDYFKKFSTLSEIITGITIDKSYGRTSINEILSTLTTESITNELSELTNYTKNNTIIKNFIGYIENITKNGIVNSFSENLNKSIKNKLNTVDWWVIIVGNQIITLKSSTMLTKMTTCKKTKKMKKSIKNFKGFKMYVNGNHLL